MSQCVANMSQWGNTARRSILYPHRGWWSFDKSHIGLVSQASHEFHARVSVAKLPATTRETASAEDHM